MTKIEEELLDIRRDVVRMGSMVIDIVLHATKAITRMDVKLARETIQEDDDIDALRFEMDERLVQAIATHKPDKEHLLGFVTAMRICADLERMADLAVNVSRAVIKLQSEEKLHIHPDIGLMGNTCVDMLGGVMEAYLAADTEQALVVSKRDDEVDAWNWEVGQYYEKAKGNQITTTECIQNVVVARCFERIGDHITNISEWIVFEKTGVHTELN